MTLQKNNVENMSYDNNNLYPIVGIDYGDKHVGIAVSDFKGIVATPLKTIHTDTIKNPEIVFEELRKVIKEYRIKRIILGMPQSFGSTDTRAQDKIISFKNMLEDSINLPVILFDESFSTKNAQDMLISSGMHSKSFKHKIDSIACALFLQEFLNFEQKNK